MSEQKNNVRSGGPGGPGGPGRPGGPHGGMMMGKPEKLKDFKGTVRRMLGYVVSQKGLIIAVFLI